MEVRDEERHERVDEGLEMLARVVGVRVGAFKEGCEVRLVSCEAGKESIWGGVRRENIGGIGIGTNGVAQCFRP
jgi:hypothetical protein